MLSEAEIKAYHDRVQKLVDEAVDFARQSPKVTAEDALTYVYAE
jgi:TPP-dependent pyruvate/acetoin dehydrogenase alpha subunit